MKKSLMAIILICALMLCGVCMAEETRPRLDTADCIVYQITNGKYRIMDLQGKFSEEDYDAFPSDQIGECAVYMANGRYGYVAKDGTVLIEPNYLALPEFENGYAAVGIEDIDALEMDDMSGTSAFPRIFGVINVYGDIVVPIEYDTVCISSDGRYVVTTVREDQKELYGLFDLEQKKVAIEPQEYSFYDVPHDGTLTAVRTVRNERTDKTGSDSNEYTSQWGIINVQGDELVPFDYDQIEYNEGFNAYTCYNDGVIVKIYEIQNGTVVEKAE